MATLACGCWTGAWWGINPPPMCAAHRNGPTADPMTWSSTRITTYKADDTTKSVPANDIDKLLVAIEKFAAWAAIDAKSNPAAHDAWLLALQHLEPLRAAIERARDVTRDGGVR